MAATRRPGRFALAGGIALSLGLAGIAAVRAHAPGLEEHRVDIVIHYSHYQPDAVTVPLGVPVTFVIHNSDPIDHEWIVGDAAVHERHRTGTEPYHASRPTEVSIAAGSTVVTTVTFPSAGDELYICHLPGHEAYGMVGVVHIVAGSG